MRRMFCFLAAVGLGAALQAQPLPGWFSAKDCGCELDKSRFREANYLRQAAIQFSPAKLRGSFTRTTPENRDGLEVIELLSGGSGTIQRKEWLKRLQQADAKLRNIFINTQFIQKWDAVENAASAGSQQMSQLRAWIMYSTCEATKLLHAFYLAYPDKAPAEHRVLYGGKTPAQTDGNQPAWKAFFSTNNLPSMGIVIAIAAGAVLLSVLLSWLMLRQPSSEAQVDKVLKSKQFGATIDQLLAGVQAQIEAQLAAIPKDSGQSGKAIQSLREQQKQFETKLQNIPVVDVGLVERLLTDLSKRVAAIEQLPKTKGGVVIDAAELAKLIEEQEAVQKSLREVLNINLLQDSIMRMLPKVWTDRQLDELEQETLKRYWFLFEHRDEFLPTFKKQLIVEVEKAVNQALKQKK